MIFTASSYSHFKFYSDRIHRNVVINAILDKYKLEENIAELYLNRGLSYKSFLVIDKDDNIHLFEFRLGYQEIFSIDDMDSLVKYYKRKLDKQNIELLQTYLILSQYNGLIETKRSIGIFDGNSLYFNIDKTFGNSYLKNIPIYNNGPFVGSIFQVNSMSRASNVKKGAIQNEYIITIVNNIIDRMKNETLDNVELTQSEVKYMENRINVLTSVSDTTGASLIYNTTKLIHDIDSYTKYTKGLREENIKVLKFSLREMLMQMNYYHYNYGLSYCKFDSLVGYYRTDFYYNIDSYNDFNLLFNNENNTYKEVVVNYEIFNSLINLIPPKKRCKKDY